MSADALRGYGTVLSRDSDGAGTYVAVGDVTSININSTAETADVTDMDSPGRFRQKIQTLLDTEITVEMNLIPDEATSYTALRTDYAAGTVRNYQVTFPDVTTSILRVPVIVTNLSKAVPVDGKMTVSVTLTGAGQPTWTT